MERLLEILALLEAPESVTDVQLGELEAELQEIFNGLRADLHELSPTDEGRVEIVANLQAATSAVSTVRELAGTRIAEAEAAAIAEAERIAAEEATIAALEEQMNGPVASGDDDEPEGDEPTVPTEDDDEVTITDEEAAAVVAEAEAAAASAPQASPAVVASLAEMRANTTPRVRANPRPSAPLVTIRAAGVNGGEFADRPQLETELLNRINDMAGAGGPDGKVRIATFQQQFPADRILPAGRITDVSEMAMEIRRKVSEPGGTEALVADGGLCGPVNIHYGLETIAQAQRPLRAALPVFQASRGGIQFDSPMTLADIGAATTPTSGNAIGVITEAQDAASTYNKSHQRITCGTPTTVKVDSVYRILEIGNLIGRTNPERTSQFTDLTLAAYARFSEQRLWAKMVANSTNVTAPQKLGAWRDWLTRLNQAAINYRGVHRMDKNARVDIVAPAWVGMGMLPDDQTNALQSYPEQFEVTVQDVEAALSRRNINVLAWYEDDWTTVFAAGGGINNYPSQFDTLMFHPGAHTLVDSGGLDFGTVRDSVLNADNVYQTFAEEFWNEAMWGVQSLRIRFSLCANGASAGSKTPVCGS